MDESGLPSVVKEALAILRSSMEGAKVDALADNWLYTWLPAIVFDATNYPPPYVRGLWVRIPIQFPFANPHGIVTKDPLNPKNGHPVKGHNPGHDMCKPVAGFGGSHYYSWTWSGELGAGPSLRNASDIIQVVSWVERRIRQA